MLSEPTPFPGGLRAAVALQSGGVLQGLPDCLRAAGPRDRRCPGTAGLWQHGSGASLESTGVEVLAVVSSAGRLAGLFRKFPAAQGLGRRVLWRPGRAPASARRRGARCPGVTPRRKGGPRAAPTGPGTGAAWLARREG